MSNEVISPNDPCPVAFASRPVSRLLEPLRAELDDGFHVLLDPDPSDGIAIVALADAPRVAELRALHPRLGIVVVADHDRFVEPTLVADVFEAGADAYVASESMVRLAAHVRVLARRQRHLDALSKVLAGRS